MIRLAVLAGLASWLACCLADWRLELCNLVSVKKSFHASSINLNCLRCVRWRNVMGVLAKLTELARLAEPLGLAGLAELAGLAGLSWADWELNKFQNAL